MRAVKSANDFVLRDPVAAYGEYIEIKPIMNTQLNRKMFERSFTYFSNDLQNVARDWNKVTQYAKRLGVVPVDFQPNYTNEFCDWSVDEEDQDPIGSQQRIAQIQKDITVHGGLFSGNIVRSHRTVKALA